MDDQQWIKRLQDELVQAGWQPVGPDPSGEGWIAGAARIEPRQPSGTGPTGGGETPVRAVEDLYRRIVGDLPDRPDLLREGETFEHELDGIPDSDLDDFNRIRDDFHREGHDLRWFHPRTDSWHMQWSPHGEVEPDGEIVVHESTGLVAAGIAWEKFQASK